ncbi:MAG: NAD-dependent epimerase/dehydratase family protein [Anaerolineae bacterium]|nr:NAD-dependent epimerase/dehydratase family protein [Anaerolineae bacterium]
MRVLVSDVAGSFGRLVAGRLLIDPAVEAVIGLDAHACYPPLAGLRFVRASLSQPEWTPLLDGIDAALYLGGVTGWPAHRADALAMLAGGRRFVQAAVAAGVPKVITVCRAAMYGAQPGAPVPETALVCGHQTGAYERAAAQFSDYLDALERDMHGTITRLRSAWLCGPGHVTLARCLRDLPPVCGCADRPVQAVHEDDLADVVMLALRTDLPGVYNVAADGGAALGDLHRQAGNFRACMPMIGLVALAWWRWRTRRVEPAPDRLRALYRVKALDVSKLQAAGWMPRYTTQAALAAALDRLGAGA